MSEILNKLGNPVRSDGQVWAGKNYSKASLRRDVTDLEQQLSEAQARIVELQASNAEHDAQVIDIMLNDKAVLKKTSICEEGYMVVDKWSMLAYVQQLRQKYADQLTKDGVNDDCINK